MSTVDQIQDLTKQEYKWGFITSIEEDRLPNGLNEDIVRAHFAQEERAGIHAGLAAQGLSPLADHEEEPTWANVHYPAHRLSGRSSYYSAPKQKKEPKSLDEVDPELLETYEKLGIPLHEQKRLAGVAVDAVFDSVSVATTFKASWPKSGIIFCSFSEAVQEHPDW